MKKTSTRTLMLAYAMGLMTVTACNEADQNVNNPNAAAPAKTETQSKDLGQAAVKDEDSDPNILNIAIGSESHSTLVAAVQAADIEHILVNAGPLTVFAPTNAGFDKLPEGTVESLLKPENKSKLATILKSHAAPGNYSQEALKREAEKGRPLFMASGDYWDVKTENGKVLVEGAEILQSIEASNGIIHIVNEVILPK